MAGRFPSVSDLKMADLYLTINFIYTFATLIEFAIVSYKPESNSTNTTTARRRKSAMEENQKSRAKSVDFNTSPITFVTSHSFTNGPNNVSGSARPVNVDFVNQSEPSNSYVTTRRVSGAEYSFEAAPTRPRHSLSGNILTYKPKRKKIRPKIRTNVDNVSKFFFPATFGCWNLLFFVSNLYLADRLEMLGQSFWKTVTQ